MAGQEEPWLVLERLLWLLSQPLAETRGRAEQLSPPSSQERGESQTVPKSNWCQRVSLGDDNPQSTW